MLLKHNFAVENMQEGTTYEQLRKKTEAEIIAASRSLDELAELFRNLPVQESAKKTHIERSLKEKSAWYACLVNSNIDVLLIPEYLESRISRNILIKKETEQYFKSLENFSLHTLQSDIAVFDCILYNEEARPKSSFDLFSSQAPESAACPDDLKDLFSLWYDKYENAEPLEALIYKMLDWHHFNRCSFSNQRQFALWIAYRFWRLYGAVSFALPIEKYLFKFWNREIRDAKEAVLQFTGFIIEETEAIRGELQVLYQQSVSHHNFRSRQKLLSNYMFETGFSLPALPGLSGDSQIIKALRRKGFICKTDLDTDNEAAELRSELRLLFESGTVLSAIDQGEIYLYLNTALPLKTSRLSRFQNINAMRNEADLESFFKQETVIPVVHIESINTPEPQAAIQVKESRKKAFFG